MQDLIAQLIRLYLPEGASAQEELEQQIDGRATRAFDLASNGAVRAIVIPFDTLADGGGARQWERLCEVANVLQGELGLPAPAVSITGGSGFCLWMSFESPVPIPEAGHFLDLLRSAYFADVILPAEGVGVPVELPPCRIAATGKWAAFIHPGMGASFADEPALEMAPPAAAQAAFLQGLQGISPAQLQHALALLQPAPEQQAPPAVPGTEPVPHGLLLKDASLEDIVRYLHAKNIEPTFRHVLPR